MPNNFATSGANPGKQTKAAPIYTGRFFSGLNTNRSPLRDANTRRTEEKFYGPAGDALIDGSNVEITNKLTLGRRPGNPLYDTVNTWQNLLSFDEFRVSKALPDVFGETTETIFTMVSEGAIAGGVNASLSAINGAFQKQAGDPASAPAVWESASPSAGQAYGVQVGNEWYFGNGVDNKKWLQSLFVRNAGNNNADVPLNTYPFMTTFLIDGNNNIQQLIGAVVQSTNQNPPASPNIANVNITHVSIAANTLTLTVNVVPYSLPAPPPIGTQYMIWSADNNPTTGQFGANGALGFLQGITITTTSLWTGVSPAIVTAVIDHPALASTPVTNPSEAVLQIEQGGAASVNNTLLLGSTVPAWSTQVPNVADNFGGGITIDGQAIWVNRGETVENWGLGAPTISLATPGLITTFGAIAANWQAGTYYSPASIATDGAGNLWLLTKPGINPPVAFPATPKFAKKFDIYTVQFLGAGVVKFGVESVGSALAINDMFQVSRLRVTNPNDTALNTQQLTLGSTLVFTVTGITTGSVALGAPSFVTAVCPNISAIAANPVAGDAGYLWTLPQSPLGPNAPTVYPLLPTATQAQWTAIQSAASLTWQPNTHYYEDDFVIQSGDYKMLYKGVQPFIHSLPPGPTGLSAGYTPPATPVTTYGFSNGNTGLGNPTFSGAAGAWPFFGYGSGVVPDITFPTPPSLWFETGSAQVQPTGPNKILFGQTGNTFFYYMGGNAYLNVKGSPGVLSLGSAVDSGHSFPLGMATVANIYVPLSGTQMTFNLDHNSGAVFGFVGAALSGNSINIIGGLTAGSPAYGASIIGTNERVPGSNEDHVWSDPGTIIFPSTGNFIFEADLASPDNSDRDMFLTIGGTFVTAPVNTVFNLAVGQDLSWVSINWLGFSDLATATPPPSYNVSPFINEIAWAQPTVEQSNLYHWMDIGPTTNYVNIAGIPYTTSGTGIVYNNSLFLPYTAGVSGATVPNSNFASATTVGTVVHDNGGTLEWMYVGQGNSSSTSTQGTITALGPQGFIYGIALVNTLDNTVSNIGPTNELNGVGIEIIGGQIAFAPGAGLNVNAIDPQSDYVAIFRTTANGSIELLVPSNGNTIYTVPLVQYLQYGYLDNTQDASLDTLIQAAAAQENTPPLPGAVNLAASLGRIWYSIGNTAFYTTGPLAPSGNGINGTAPGNTDSNLARVTRLVPSSIGMLTFTLSDTNVIPFNNGAILPGQTYVPGLGLSSYNALDINGTLIGLFTTDHQFVIFTPQRGVDHEGHPIANLLRLQVQEPGEFWNPVNAYVAWYVNGEDMGWFLADGLYGWYRLIQTPAPEEPKGCWSPFATINPGFYPQGCGAIKSVEVAPGDHRLLIGPALHGGSTGLGSILYRDLDASTDGGSGANFTVNGTTYAAFAVFGSYVCAQPGQVAMINFITTDSVNVGSPLILGVLLDEALPYFMGSFDILKRWETDPPNLPQSRSILGQRFYLSELDDEAALCRHMQVLVQWPPEAALNELQSFTIFGSFGQEA